MISRLCLLKAAEGVSEEDFRAALTGSVSGVIAGIPNLRKCELDFVTDRTQRSHAARGVIDIDGFIEMFFDSFGDMQEGLAAAGSDFKAALAPVVSDTVLTMVVVKKQDTLVPEYLKNKAIKRVSFCDRLEGIDAMAFQDEWWNTHSVLVKLMGGYCGYNQNLVVDRMVNGETVHYDKLPVEGMVEFWFENMDAFDECYGNNGYAGNAYKKHGSVHAAQFIGTVTTYFVESVPVELDK